MTAAERRQAWAPYFRALADLMGLRDWTVQVASGPPEAAEARASVQPLYGRRIANVWLSDEFLDDADPADQRQTACHELVHCLFADCAQIAEEELEPAAWRAWRRQFEHGIDAVASAFAEALPLPAKVLGSKRRPR
jgi:hypothetical protein